MLTSRSGRFLWRVLRPTGPFPAGRRRTTRSGAPRDGREGTDGPLRVEEAALKRATALAAYWPLNPLW